MMKQIVNIYERTSICLLGEKIFLYIQCSNKKGEIDKISSIILRLSIYK